jgi:thymidylate kinase
VVLCHDMEQQLITISTFTKLGFSVSTESTHEHIHEVKLLVKNNNDGTARWVWPASLKSPDFLSFYLESSARSRMIATAIRGAFRLGFKEAFISTGFSLWMSQPDIDKWNDQFGEKWSLFTGTVGPYRKAILHFNKDEKDFFVKVGMTERSDLKLSIESSFLNQIAQKNIPQLVVPKVWDMGNSAVMMDDISKNGSRVSRLTNLHWFVLRNIHRASGCTQRIDQLPAFQRALKTVESLKHTSDSRIPKGIVEKLEKVAQSIDVTQSIRVSLAHGDFTPWNMYVNGSDLNVYDWEMTTPNMPVLFDAFHFISQSGILEHRWDFERIEKEMNLQMLNGVAQQLLHESQIDFELSKKLYFLLFVSSQLEMYTIQEKWHLQVNWLLNTWNEALSTIMHTEKQKTARQLLLIDSFDYLKNTSYACLKWTHESPEELPIESDIDLVMSKSDSVSFEEMLRDHPLVDRVFCVKRSFMRTIQIETKDGEWLTFDLISQLKRKSKEFMNVNDVIQSSEIHSSGVRVANIIDQFMYTMMFFTLNGSRIPEKYIAFYSAQSEEIQKKAAARMADFIGVSKLKFEAILESNKEYHEAIATAVSALKCNKGFAGIKNQLAYTVDNLPLIHHQKGFIITFSGVDGAGKSTVIEHVKTHLEKVMRRRVVVIRHRPSLLPILSAYTHGKAQAEKMAADRLPRKGTNKSTFSSLLRFGYYYLDYLFGQFIVMVKYTMRGYVVLYDRYYYDFMHDSKRSNIKVPEYITNFGFNFLMKPSLNFYLYASAAAIRKRKQELEVDEINELSAKYLKQFNEWNMKQGEAKFVTIHNVHLENTLRVIQHQISLQVA